MLLSRTLLIAAVALLLLFVYRYFAFVQRTDDFPETWEGVYVGEASEGGVLRLSISRPSPERKTWSWKITAESESDALTIIEFKIVLNDSNWRVCDNDDYCPRTALHPHHNVFEFKDLSNSFTQSNFMVLAHLQFFKKDDKTIEFTIDGWAYYAASSTSKKTIVFKRI